jgi:hypothetical protein
VICYAQDHIQMPVLKKCTQSTLGQSGRICGYP